MISICIPVYNFDVSALVAALQSQAVDSERDIEIVLIDDASDESFRQVNNLPGTNTRYIQLEQNIGRARIRNLFLLHTRHPFLLFLDCDSSINHNPAFLRNYLKTIETGSTIVCGGRIYPDQCPSPQQQLSWKYGRMIESKPSQERGLYAARCFMSNNFLIQRDILKAIPFEETIYRYGHEDTLFGIKLEKQGLPITHIENPVLNLHIETTGIFLSKTREAVLNLVHLIITGRLSLDDQKKIRLLKTYNQLKKLKLANLWGYCFKLLKNQILENLRSSDPSLFYFNLYKLGVLHEICGRTLKSKNFQNS